MRRVFGYASAAILLVFPVLLSATFPAVTTNTWSAAQPLSTTRSGAATVMLQDGRLLITGGNSGTSSVASVDIVDTAGNVTAAAPMNIARSQHTATVLQDGRVLVAGGVDVSGNPIGTAEIFDPAVNPAQANPWTSTGPLVQARSGQTATLLNDGTVLIAGGLSGGQVLNTLELFDAASGVNGSFTMLSVTLSSPRAKHTAVLLEDGRVLIMGGWDGTMTAPQPPATTGTPNPLATTDLYDASAQQVRAGPALNVARMSLTATTQLDGQVFVAGGNDGTQDLASTETFDPATSPQPATFARSLSLTTPRSNHLAFLLPHNGGTLLVGGMSDGTTLASAELYMPVYLSQAQTATLTPVPATMSTARAYATGSPLSDGTVSSVNDGLLLVAAGVDGSGKTLSSSELFAFPWVKTDALEYAPGTPVNITGGGFQPDETVTLHFQETPYYDAPADLTVVVQSDGTFSNSQFSPDTYDLNIGFFLTATGSSSHNQAQTVFADNYPKNNLTIAVSPAAGSPNANSIVAGTNGSGSSDVIAACTTISGCSNSNAIGPNKTISITATAGTGYVFSSWTVSGAPAGSTCTNGSATNPCTLNSGTGNNTTTVTANFKLGTTISVVAGTGTYGSTATLSATLAAGSTDLSGKTINFTLKGTPVGSAITNPSGVATLSNVDLSGFSAGTLSNDVSAGFAGDSTYEPSNGTGDLVVSPASLTITADAQTKTYGQTDPTLTYTASGFQFSDTAASVLSGSLTRTTGETVAGNPYTISQGTLAANGNYTISFTGNTLTITPATLTVTADAQTKVYGQSDPTLTYKANGFQFSDTAASALTGSLARTAGETVAGSSYAISQGTLAVNSNYTISFTGSTLTITPAPLAVTANSQSKTYGDSDPALTYEASGFQFSDTAASVLTGFLTRAAGETVAGGPYAISQGTLVANSNYTIAFTGSTLTITPAPLTVTANSQTKTYGDPDPALSYMTSGFKFSDAAASVLTGSLTRAAGENVGPYAISQGTLAANSNYTISFTGSTLTVTPAPLTVTANSQTKTYGDPDPALSYAAIGFKFSDSATSVLTGSLTRAAGESVAGSPYAISQGTLAANSNYTISFTGSTLTITPAPLAVTANAQSKVYGDSDPPLTYSVSGFKSGDAAGSVLTGSLARSAGETVAGSPYTISEGSLTANSNYTISFTGSTLVIKPATLTVSADAKTKVYGQSDPALTYTVGGLQLNDTAGSVLAGSLTRVSGETVAGSPYAISQGTLAANSNYTISFTGSTLTITPATLTITASSTSKTYGQTVTFAGTEFSTSGLVTGDSVTGVTLTSTGAAPAATVQGSPYDIVASNATGSGLGNYSIMYMNGKLTVTAAVLTVTADPETKVYGQPDPALSYKVSGLQAGDIGTAVLSGTLSRNPGENVGGSPYAILQGSLAANSNYSISFTGDSLTITPATLTVTITATNKVYDGTTAANITGCTLTGVLGNDVVTCAAGQASFASANVGTWVVTANIMLGGASAGNYMLSSPTATTSAAIGKADPKITVTQYNVTYDGNAHTATGSAIGVQNEALSGLNLSGTTHTNPGVYKDTWTFTDVTGNYNNKSGTVQDVIGYEMPGLQAPYAPPPATFNVQRTMPVVWQYTNVNGAVVNSAAANPQVQIFSCGTIPDNSTQDITVDSAGSSGYQYNSTTNTWQFNWQVKASNLQAGCYDIYIVSGQTGQMSKGFPIYVTTH